MGVACGAEGAAELPPAPAWRGQTTHRIDTPPRTARTAFELVDQRSLNGTYVNGERVDRAVLTNGSELRIGKFRLNFFVSPADLPQAG